MSDLRDLFLQHLRLSTTDFPAWLHLLDDDIVLEFPYARSAGNPELVRGKAAVADGIKSFLESVPTLTFINPQVYLTNSPGEGFATYQADAPVPATGRRYTQGYISRLQARDGLLTFISEYYDPVQLIRAFELPIDL